LQLALDAHASPRAVLPAETNDELYEFVAERRSTGTTLPAPPPPLALGGLAVPTQQGLGCDEERPPTQTREQPTERGEDRPVCRPVTKASVQLTFQDVDLVPEHHELDVGVGRGSSR
jgi:hypothetical protein